MEDQVAGVPPMGWMGVDQTQQRFAAQFPALSVAAPGLYGSTSNDPVLLYKAYKDVLGDYPPYKAQEIGDCVSQGMGRALDNLQCVEISLGEPTEYRETHTEFIYATSREVAGILGSGDGSYGSAAVKAAQRIGVITREMAGSDGAYSGARARSWGRTGAPAQYKRAASEFRLGAIAQVRTWDDLVAAVRNGYLVTIASSQGFTLTRDAQGFCRASGRWMHQMFIAGIRFDRPGACVMQSWGPNNPTGPTALDQPSFSFWADRPVVEGILRQGDSWAIANAPDFVKRDLPASWSYRSLA